jgi:CP family cyanate transporter-like MFS transporter
VLVAFSLRSAVAALSPIISEVQADFAVPTWVAGLIGTAPPVCFAVFGIVTPILERRFGLERLAAASMLIVTAALIARSLAGMRPRCCWRRRCCSPPWAWATSSCRR